jgi:SnoaL-like domain
VFAEDVHFDISADVPGCVLRTPQAIVAMTSAGLQDCVSVHHGYCPEINISSETTGEGVWPIEDMLRWNDGAKSPIHTLHGYGHCLETYRKINGSWRIQTLKLTRLRVDTTGWESPQ